MIAATEIVASLGPLLRERRPGRRHRRLDLHHGPVHRNRLQPGHCLG